MNSQLLRNLSRTSWLGWIFCSAWLAAAPLWAQTAASRILRNHPNDWLLGLDFLAGKWSGSGTMLSQGGTPTETPFSDDYDCFWSPNGEFLRSESTSRMPQTENNPGRILNQRWGFLTYDQENQRLLEFVFYTGGSVVTFRVLRLLGAGGQPIDAWQFEALESLNPALPGQRLRRTYTRSGPAAFDVQIEVAPPQADWIKIAELHYRRSE